MAQIIKYLIEVEDHADQCAMERRLSGEGGYAFIEAGVTEYQSLEEAERGIKAEQQTNRELAKFEDEYGG